MQSKKIVENLQHGYAFLSLLVAVAFVISLSVEIYLAGGLHYTRDNHQDPSVEEGPSVVLENFDLIIQNLKGGHKTTDEKVTLVGITFTDATVIVNGRTVEVDSVGKFEAVIELIIGKNQVVVTGELGEEKVEKSITIIREAKPKPEETTQQPTPTSPNPGDNQQPVRNPAPKPEPTPTPIPKPSKLTGIKMSCSVSNTQPFVGESVNVNCRVTDQNGKAVQGAFGYVTVSLQTGNQVKTLSQSNSAGNMSASFAIPAGNSGKVNGSIKASKDGLSISSNFSINVNV